MTTLAGTRALGGLSFFQKILRLNWALILLIGAIAGCGFLMLYSVAGDTAVKGSLDPWARRQIVRFSAGIGLLLD